MRTATIAALVMACGTPAPPVIPSTTPSPPAAPASIDASTDTLEFAHHGPPCDPANAGPDLVLGTVTNVDRRRVYKIANTTITLCVVRTAYPLMRGGGHKLWAMVDLVDTDNNDTATYDLDGAHFARWHGLRVDLGVAKKDFMSPEVWVRVTRAIAPSPQ